MINMLAWMKRALGWLRRWRTKTARAPTPDPLPANLNATVARQPGLTCPRCAFRIQITIPALLSMQPLHCSNCFLALNVDMTRSREALEALQKLEDALTRAEAIAKRS